MKITDALLGEHGVFYVQFGHLERTAAAAATLDQVQTSTAVLAVCLKTHARLEDELLFTALEPYLGRQMGPLAVMRMEHDHLERNLDHLPEVQDLAEAQGLVLDTIQVARDHFAKEEQILFRMAQQALDTETLTQLGTQWARRQGVSIS